jgi:hypothetical protein
MPQAMKSPLPKPIRPVSSPGEVDNLSRYTSFLLLQPHHDVCRLDIPVDKVLFVNCCQSGSHLRRNFQRHPYVQSAGAFDESFERFTLHQLHCIELTVPGSAQVEDRGNIWVTDARRCPRFTQKTKSRRWITHILLANDLQRYRTPQIDIERLVCDAHRAPTQLDRFPVVTRHQLVVVKSIRRLF